mgnify:CR=1 FL=1
MHTISNHIFYVTSLSKYISCGIIFEVYAQIMVECKEEVVADNKDIMVNVNIDEIVVMSIMSNNWCWEKLHWRFQTPFQLVINHFEKRG